MGESEVGPALGARVRALREGRRWSQRELGERLGVSHSFVSGMELGRYLPNVAMLRQVAAVLGTPYMALAVLAGYADAAAEEAEADGRWFAGLPPEVRRLVRELIGEWPREGVLRALGSG